MKRLWTPLAIGFAALAAFVLAPSMGALAGQQTFSNVSTGWGPAPGPTATSMNVESYLNLYPGYWPYHWYPPCTTGHCHPVRPVHPIHPGPGHPIAPPPAPRPVPPRP